ncbi:hypothetical protein [Microbulbifer variabilis]|uniref:hypothetical protein n=1 Tax=Microbulbifer variabilis TaxID=266805 RepID=UPI001CFE4E00|nr:hypothetical protein [Microbulbifer variabilis]
MNHLPVKISTSSNLPQQSIKYGIDTIYYLSTNAELFYKASLTNLDDLSIKEIFTNLKDLHKNVKTLLEGASFNASSSTKEWIIKRRPIAIIAKRPPNKLINRLIECENFQRHQQLQIIRSIGDCRLRMALSALTARQQMAIEQLTNSLINLNHEKSTKSTSEKLGMDTA